MKILNRKSLSRTKFTAFVFIANIAIIITFACYRCIVFLACTMAYSITILCHRIFLSQSFVLLKSQALYNEAITSNEFYQYLTC